VSLLNHYSSKDFASAKLVDTYHNLYPRDPSGDGKDAYIKEFIVLENIVRDAMTCFSSNGMSPRIDWLSCHPLAKCLMILGVSCHLARCVNLGWKALGNNENVGAEDIEDGKMRDDFEEDELDYEIDD
jgi:hypothetical protein